MKKTIYMILMFAVALISSAYALEVSSPEQGYVYNTSTIDIDVESNETLDMLNYSIDGAEFFLACENCSEFESVANLSEGNHSMEFIAWKGNESETVVIDFSILLPQDEYNDSISDENETDDGQDEDYDILDTLEVISPIEDHEYNTIIIDLKVDVNGTLDMLNYSIDDSSHVIACENCSVFESEVNLSEGDHTIEFFAWSGNDSKRIEVDFSIELPDDDENETDDGQDEDEEDDYSPKNESYGQPRFDLGFEKLPQAFEAGEISDDELAKIIRENNINPGILNRLIKTGKLGNESLEAILDTQFQPHGLFRKILSFIGLGEDSYAEQIYENYNVSEKIQQKLLEREDLPKGQAKKLQEQMQEQVQARSVQGTQGQGNDENNGNRPFGPNNTLNIGQQENPGQGNSNGNGKNLDAPGQTKKGGNSGKGNGRN